MNIFRDMPNSQIEQAIERIYKTEKNRAILHDRVIGEMTYVACGTSVRTHGLNGSNRKRTRRNK